MAGELKRKRAAVTKNPRESVLFSVVDPHPSRIKPLELRKHTWVLDETTSKILYEYPEDEKPSRNNRLTLTACLHCIHTSCVTIWQYAVDCRINIIMQQRIFQKYVRIVENVQVRPVCFRAEISSARIRWKLFYFVLFFFRFLNEITNTGFYSDQTCLILIRLCGFD